ncbi:sensor histidine kinase [Desulfosporosinus youngiae]|uniref:histidine kinase n=1 Tax=Desulfosporosinus youngiae DSM 17734 TaxID=768710 RepID=H5XXK8_9FIRM|nr:ATP-binding protein [Desulfosporosinus youngiae]EHQ91214.1 signal transduction histidine kinase [Desulfosporosinus youngiae DSM 17734]
MKHEPLNKPTNRIGHKLRFSLVWKLNFKLFLRLLGIFLVLDTLLFLASVTGLIVRADQTAAAAAKMLSQTGLPSPDAENWLELTGYSVSLDTGEPQGFPVPESLLNHLSKQTASGVRSIDLPDPDDIASWEQLDGITYNLTTDYNGRSYLISIRLQETLQILAGIFVLLLTMELFILLGSIFSGAGTIRKALRPIEEFAKTAQNLHTGGVFTPEQLEVLAGKLDDINATRLDTRIPVDDTQSELKTLASAINGMLDRINESYRSQVRFVSDASHELRTPISVIQGYANLLDRWGKKDEKTLQESINAIKDETANMKGLVEQLLFLARGDNNTMAMQIERFELSDLAVEVLRETQMIDGGHEYESSVSPVFIKADKSLIKQGTRILIDNAMKYTPPGKRIKVSVSSEHGFARLTVQDEGIGIPPEAVPKIFDRFFRADESRARATGGTGLGLSIAKWITERHGGHIEVLSRLDIGTRISILLPSAPEV